MAVYKSDEYDALEIERLVMLEDMEEEERAEFLAEERAEEAARVREEEESARVLGISVAELRDRRFARRAAAWREFSAAAFGE